MEEFKLSNRQIRLITNFLTCSTIEEACRKSSISKGTYYNWLKDENFRTELKRQRDEVVNEALDRLKFALTKAIEELIKLINSPKPELRRLACKDIVDYTLRSIEIENIEERLNKIEKHVYERRI